MLAEAVCAGRIDADEDARRVLLQCHQITRRNKGLSRGHLNLVQAEAGDQE